MKQLPCAAGENRAQPSMADFRAFVEASTLSVQWPESADGDYKSLMQRERLSDYESLA